MPAIGGGTAEIRTIINTIFHTFTGRPNSICVSTCDGLVLRMHYKWSFYMFLIVFLTVWYSWYRTDSIACVSHFNAETQIRFDYINVCLSYPYVENEGSRRYLLYYRWIHWSFLIISVMYYSLRRVSKAFDNARCKKLLKDLAVNEHRYDKAEELLVNRAARYVLFNFRTHNGLYWKYLTVNVLALLSDIIAMIFLDFNLQQRFLQYGIKAYPYDRNPQNFSDYMSQTFPPFASCEITGENQLVNKRTEKFGCHLTLMELYEKVFLFIWLWLIIQTLATCCYIVLLSVLWIPFVKSYLLRFEKPWHVDIKVNRMIKSVSKNCKIGDIYLLYCIKFYLSHARFSELMSHLSNAQHTKQENIDLDNIEEHKLHAILSTSTMTEHEDYHQSEQITPLFKTNNTAIPME